MWLELFPRGDLLGVAWNGLDLKGAADLADRGVTDSWLSNIRFPRFLWKGLDLKSVLGLEGVNVTLLAGVWF